MYSLTKNSKVVSFISNSSASMISGFFRRALRGVRRGLRGSSFPTHPSRASHAFSQVKAVRKAHFWDLGEAKERISGPPLQALEGQARVTGQTIHHQVTIPKSRDPSHVSSASVSGALLLPSWQYPLETEIQPKSCQTKLEHANIMNDATPMHSFY